MGGDILSISVGAHSVQYVLGQARDGLVVVKHIAKQQLSWPVHRDGALLDPVALAMEIKPFLHKERLRSRRVVFSLQTGSLRIKVLELPDASPTQRQGMLRCEFERILSAPVDPFLLEFLALEPNRETGLKRFQVFALPMEITKGYWLLAKALGLRPVALDLHVNGLRKLCGRSGVINDRPNLLDAVLAVANWLESAAELYFICGERLLGTVQLRFDSADQRERERQIFEAARTGGADKVYCCGEASPEQTTLSYVQPLRSMSVVTGCGAELQYCCTAVGALLPGREKR